MSWIQLFKVKSFEDALKKRTKGVFHVDPILKGNKLRQVVKVFDMVKLPFVFKEKLALKENNPNSPYHKFPKGIAKKNKQYIERVLKIRQGIITSREKEIKWRNENLQSRPVKGMDLFIKSAMPYIIKQAAVTRIGEAYKARRKTVSEFVRDVPKLKDPEFNRRAQEKYKILVENDLIAEEHKLTSSPKKNAAMKAAAAAAAKKKAEALKEKEQAQPVETKQEDKKEATSSQQEK